jgi:integrase/recombinase XerD
MPLRKTGILLWEGNIKNVNMVADKNAEHPLQIFAREMRLRNYSERTIATYTSLLKMFIEDCNTKSIDETNSNIVKQYIENKVSKGDYSFSFQNQLINSLKLYYQWIHHIRLENISLPRPKRPKVLPDVLSKEEVKKLLDVTINPKHKIALSLIYACGLRRSELLNLKITDIDSKRMVIWIRAGKGQKDRFTPLPEPLLLMLREYWKAYKPKLWLFEGQWGEQYSGQSLHNVFKNALHTAKINKDVSLHNLRHSYATHLHEAGTDIYYIQQLLGHKHVKTTEIYTHISKKKLEKIRSPFEDL